MFGFLRNLRKKLTNEKGYSLVEYSISTTIIILLASSGLALLQKKNEAAKVRETERKIEKIEKSIQSFIRASGYVPCPALPAILDASTNFGRSEGMTIDVDEGVAATTMYNTVSEACSNNSMANGTGVVPVKTLHLDYDYIYDGWGRKFTYRTAEGSGSAADFGDREYYGDLAIVDAKGIHKTNIKKPAPGNDGAIYVVISHGSNAKDTAWGKNTTTAPASQATGAEGSNTKHTTKTYVQALQTENFDDIVTYGIKSNFVVPKEISSPIHVDSLVCNNAKAMVRQAELDANYFDNVPGSLPALLLKNATKLSHLCENKSADRMNPSKLSGLMLWLDASDHKTLFTNINCVGGAEPANAAGINCWKDKSGNDFHSKVLGDPATYNTGQQHNRPSVYIGSSNGSNGTIMQSDIGTQSLSRGVTSLLVTRVINRARDWGRIFSVKVDGLGDHNSPNGFGFQTHSTEGLSWFGTNNLNTIDMEIDGTFTIYSLLLDTVNLKAYSNGALSSIGTYNHVTMAPNQVVLNGADAPNHFRSENDFSEVVVFDRALRDGERRKMEHYLSDKWGIPLLDSREGLCSAGMTFRRTADKPDGDCLCPDGMMQSRDLQATNACFAGSRAALGGCVPASSKPEGVETTLDVSGLRMWLDADDCSTILLDLAGKVEQWSDKSGKGNHAVQVTPGDRPGYSSGTENGRSVVTFNASTQDKVLVPNLSGMTSGELFVVFKKVQDPASAQSNSGSWHFSIQNSGGSAHLPFTNGAIIDSFGTDTRRFTSVSPGVPFTNRGIFNITARSGYWAMWLNGAMLRDYNTNTVAFGTGVARLGQSAGAYYFNGDMGEVMIYQRSLPQLERDSVTKYLSDKWSVFVNPNQPDGSELGKTNSLSDGLKLWLDAADSSTVFKSSACTGTRASRDDEVGCWADKSPAGTQDATQTAIQQRPKYELSAINILPALRFDGWDDFMSLPDNTLPSGNTPYSIFFVNSPSSDANKTGSFRGMLSLSIVTETNRSLFFRYREDNKVNDGWYSNNITLAANVVGPSPHILSFIYDKASGRVVNVDGAQFATNASTSLNFLNNNNARLGITDGTTYMYGDMGEIMAYERTLSDIEIEKIEGFLSDKWSIVVQ